MLAAFVSCMRDGHPDKVNARAQSLASLVTEPPEISVPPIDAPGHGDELGSFVFTYYWLARETRRAGEDRVMLYTKHCRPLTEVGASFARRLHLEGAGRLKNGRVLNVAGHCECPTSPCYFSPPKHKEWGVGYAEKPLRPFRSVAVDRSVVPIGKPLYIPEIDGLTMPGKAPWGGFVHDGCVVAEDTGGSVDGQQLDFFVALRRYYKRNFKVHRFKRVAVHEGGSKCAYLAHRTPVRKRKRKRRRVVPDEAGASGGSHFADKLRQ